MKSSLRTASVFSTVVCCFGALVLLAACGPAPAAPAATATPTDMPPMPTATIADPTPVPTVAPSPEPTATAEPTELAALPAAPQEIAFAAEDGQALHGTYYPAASNMAPLVVLMHWAPGDETDWVMIASWLQNRVDLTQVVAPYEANWQDPSWFPAMSEDASYAVFTFTFRGCEGGCKEFAREGWLLDARAGVATAQGLEGVDPERTALVGASIGGDGVVDACAQGCLGAFSLSPGDYLTLGYASQVERLQAMTPPAPAACLAADGDAPSAAACRAAGGDDFEMVIYPGDEHGMMLIRPDADPEVLQSILDFLKDTLGG